jgi:ketosteroid isomerase-like protein
VQVIGNQAWCRTHLKMTMTPPKGNIVRRSGNTLSILRKEPDGKWVMIRDANMLAAE